MSRLEASINPGNFTFLGDLYKEECDEILFSPEEAAAKNLATANAVAVKLLAALNVYGFEPTDQPESSPFPINHIEDPCQNLPFLPLRLTPGYGSSWSVFKNIHIYSSSLRNPEKYYPLGTVEVFDPLSRAPGVMPSQRETYISKVNLHRFRFGGQRPELAKYPSQTDKGFIDGYPLNNEAMNLIDMVDQYLEQLGKGRLVVVS